MVYKIILFSISRGIFGLTSYTLDSLHEFRKIYNTSIGYCTQLHTYTEHNI